MKFTPLSTMIHTSNSLLLKCIFRHRNINLYNIIFHKQIACNLRSHLTSNIAWKFVSIHWSFDVKTEHHYRVFLLARYRCDFYFDIVWYRSIFFFPRENVPRYNDHCNSLEAPIKAFHRTFSPRNVAHSIVDNQRKPCISTFPDRAKNYVSIEGKT